MSEGRKIYYTDETWCNVHHQKEKMWRGTHRNPKTGKEEFIRGGMATIPEGEGSRIIICHISRLIISIIAHICRNSLC